MSTAPLFARIALAMLWTASTLAQSAPNTDSGSSDPESLARAALNLEKQGRSLEAREAYEKIATSVRTGFYSEDLVAAAAYLDAARMRIKGAGQYGENIDREANLKGIFSELKEAERLLNEAATARLSPLDRQKLFKLAGTPIHMNTDGPCLPDPRKLLLARLYFVRGNLNRSSAEIEDSLSLFRAMDKNCPRADPELKEDISYVSAVQREVSNSPVSRDNLLKTAETLSKLVPKVGAFLPPLIVLVDQWVRSHQESPRI